MASEIKKISKFSADAIDMVYEKLPEEEKERMKNNFRTMLGLLGTKKQTTTKKSSDRIPDEDIFKKSILPQIYRKIEELEAAELRMDGLEIPIDFSCIETDFVDIKINQLAAEHNKILQLENSLKATTLVIQFIRGKFYLFAREALSKESSNLESTVKQVLNVPYRTFLRYASLANMLFCFPRLIVCGLSFTQILLHQKRLLKFLKSEEGQLLRDRLSVSVSLKAINKTITIERCDINVVSTNFNTSPDWEYRDLTDQSKLPEDQLSSAFDGAVEAYRNANEEAELLDSL